MVKPHLECIVCANRTAMLQEDGKFVVTVMSVDCPECPQIPNVSRFKVCKGVQVCACECSCVVHFMALYK